jgi:DNA-binding MarR family transcriptional regulator
MIRRSPPQETAARTNAMPDSKSTPAASGPDLLRRQVQRFVREFGLLADDRTPCGAPLSPREAHALMIVLERERLSDPPRQNDLAATLGIAKCNVTRLVQRLRRDGRIQQRPREDDGRARILRLTQKGRRLAETIERTSRARFETLLADIPAEGHELVLSALALLNDAIGKRSPDGLPRIEERTISR